MKGATAEDWLSQIKIPNRMKVITIGVIHQSLFSHKKQNSSFKIDTFEKNFLATFNVLFTS